MIFQDWGILLFAEKVIKEATHVSLDKGVDLEDVLQCLCAKENGCETVLTSDKKFVDCGIPVKSYELFLGC